MQFFICATSDAVDEEEEGGGEEEGGEEEEGRGRRRGGVPSSVIVYNERSKEWRTNKACAPPVSLPTTHPYFERLIYMSK